MRSASTAHTKYCAASSPHSRESEFVRATRGTPSTRITVLPVSVYFQKSHQFTPEYSEYVLRFSDMCVFLCMYMHWTFPAPLAFSHFRRNVCVTVSRSVHTPHRTTYSMGRHDRINNVGHPYTCRLLRSHHCLLTCLHPSIYPQHHLFHQSEFRQFKSAARIEPSEEACQKRPLPGQAIF
jgi:hypothetical protein